LEEEFMCTLHCP